MLGLGAPGAFIIYMSDEETKRFTAVILAADRSAADPVARAAGVSCKALAPVGGRPMVLRVLRALEASQEVGTRLLCGPPARILKDESVFQQLMASGSVGWLPPRATPSTSALAAFEAIAPESPVLLTTADHALLQAEVVDYFCSRARALNCDVVAALASHSLTVAQYPGMRRTRTRFSDGDVCGCNLFAFLTPDSRAAADSWRQVEDKRKRPLQMLGELGWGIVLRYLLGRLSLKDALRHISSRMGVRAGVVMLPFPNAAVDVDSVTDWHFAQTIASRLGA